MRKLYFWSIKLLLTAAILFVIVWKVDFQAVKQTFSSLAPAAVLVAFVIVVFQTVCAAVRLSILTAAFGRHLRLHDSLRISLESIFFGQTFVSTFGSDALRIWRVRRTGLSLEQTTNVIVLDRLIGIVANHVLLLLCLPWLLMTIQDKTVRTGLVVLALAGVAAIAVMLLLGFLRERTFVAGTLEKKLKSTVIVNLIVEAMTVGRHLPRPSLPLVKANAIALLVGICNCLVFFVLLSGWGVDPRSAFLAALLVPAVLEIAMLPISIGGWGVREGAAIVAFGAVGISAPIAFGASVAYALIVLVLGLVGGALWLLDRGTANDKTVGNRDGEPTVALKASTAKLR